MKPRPCPCRVAVVGAGPAGVYTAAELLRAAIEVDVLERQPAPFGLVRTGVAPDRGEAKRLARKFERTARHQGFRFFGGVQFGTDVTREELLQRYHAVVYTVGSAVENRLEIAGEGRPGVHGARAVLTSCNGDAQLPAADLGRPSRRAVVVGNGSAAIDVARMLSVGPDALAATGAARHAIAAPGAGRVREVVILGRRGPAQAAFTSTDLEEIARLPGVDVVVREEDLRLDAATASWLESDADVGTRANVARLREFATQALRGHERRIELRFLWSPVEVLGDGRRGPVTGLRAVRNALAPGKDGRPLAVPTGPHESIECGLLVRAIGSRGHPLAGVPFDERRGSISNEAGRVTDRAGRPCRGEYAAGWIKRGASGIIRTNERCAAETVAHLLEDAEAEKLGQPASADAAGVAAWLRARVPGLVSCDGS